MDDDQNKFGTPSTSAGPSSQTPAYDTASSFRHAPGPHRRPEGNRRSCAERSRIEAGTTRCAAACERGHDGLIDPSIDWSIRFSHAEAAPCVRRILLWPCTYGGPCPCSWNCRFRFRIGRSSLATALRTGSLFSSS
jgi:hypothetical protein